MVRRRTLQAAVLLLAVWMPLNAQQEGADAESIFYDAEFWYTQEKDYQEAAYLYKQLVVMEPDNSNVKYLLGMCYNQIRGNEEKAIPYFKEATRDITLKYKEGKYAIKQAPHHSWFYLADTYRKINQLDSAILALESFSSLKDFDKHYNVSITEDAISLVERAKIIRDAELNLRALYFKEPINTQRDDYSGVISADGTMMTWVTSKAFYEGIFMSRREDKDWSLPVEISSQIVSDGNMVPTGLSADGNTMLLAYAPEKGHKDIWYSQFDGMYWSPAQAVHGAINSSSNEQHASFSPNGNRIYFSSDRRGGQGQYDIWFSDRKEDGQWTTPVNMGPNINSELDETCAYIAPGEGRFIFASQGHFNMGGFDIFHCEAQTDGTWGSPVNMGYPINTTGNDLSFVPLNDGLSGLYSRFTSMAIGMTDLWYMEIQREDGVLSEGMVLAIDSREGIANRDFALILVDQESGEEIEVIYDAQDNSFKAVSGRGKEFRVVSYKK